MQHIINFLIRNSYRMLFLLLTLISLNLVYKSHSFHRSKYITSSNAVSGYVYEKVNAINEFLSLRSKNVRLAQENAALKEILYNTTDSLSIRLKNPDFIASLYEVRNAKVIKNTYNTRYNYLTINKGSLDSIYEEMAVVNDKGIVGVVETTSSNYATVISVLHVNSRINAKIKGSNHFGTLVWDGKNAGYVQLTDVPRLASIRKGDSVVTGAETLIFPENIPIGKIEKLYIDKKTNYYTIDVRLFNDMTALGYVNVIENKQQKELQELELKKLELLNKKQ